MKIKNTKSIVGLEIIEPIIHVDNRGWFMETYNNKMKLGNLNFIQENHSYTKYALTFRGFHHQNEPYSQDKIVRCVRGRILDIVIDLRPNSPTYLNSVSIELNDSNKKLLFIPKGCFHGFLTLNDDVEVVYKVNKEYSAESEVSLSPFDPNLNMVNWQGHKILHISDKDKNGKKLNDIL